MSMSSHPFFDVQEAHDVTVIRFTNRKILGEDDAKIIGDQLDCLIENFGQCKLLLNFKNVEYLSSSFLGKLIAVCKKINISGGRMALCNIDPQIYEVFVITKLNRLFHIEKDDSEDNWGGVKSRLIPPKPTDSQFIALQLPRRDTDPSARG